MTHDRQLRFVATLLIVLGLCGFLISFAISFQSLGMGQGLDIGNAELEQYRDKENAIHFSGAGGPNTHTSIASDYWAISVAFLVIAVIGLIQYLRLPRQVLLPLFCVASASVAANFLRVLIRDKALVDDSFYQAPRNHFVKLTLAYDWFFLILVVAVVLISSFLIIRIIVPRPT